jgi:diguanylate cyclase (GGDEF)-like protein
MKPAPNRVLIPRDLPQRARLERLLRDGGLEPKVYHDRAEAEQACADASPGVLLLAGETYQPVQAQLIKHVRSTCPGVFIVGMTPPPRTAASEDDAAARTDTLLSPGSSPEEIAVAVRLGDAVRRSRAETEKLRAELDSLQSENIEQIYRFDRLREAFAELERRADSVQRQALTDELTGLYNRRHFIHAAEQELERARREDSAFAITFIDVDHFKQINDTFGHLKGDEVLRELATTLRHNVRRMDTVARYGGEEFVILLPGAGQQAFDAGSFTDRLRATIAGTSFAEDAAGGNLHITMSAGVAHYPRDGDSVETLIARADTRLYRAKADGRNRVFADD